MRAFEFHPEAEQELLAATRWYDHVRPELGDRFESEVERAIRRILKHPRLFRSLTRAPGAAFSGHSPTESSLHHSPSASSSSP